MSGLDWLGLIAFAAVAYGINTAIRRWRSNSVEAVASEIGFSFQRKDRSFWDEELAGLRLMKQGCQDDIGNVLKGERLGVPVWIFDFTYTIHSGDSTSDCAQTVAAFRIGERIIPNFELRPEGLAQKLGALLGQQDIDFPEYPAFSARYLLRGTSVHSVRPLFHHGVLRRLEEARGGLSIEGGGHWLILYRHCKRLKARKIPEFLREAWEIFSAFRLS